MKHSIRLSSCARRQCLESGDRSFPGGFWVKFCWSTTDSDFSRTFIIELLRPSRRGRRGILSRLGYSVCPATRLRRRPLIPTVKGIAVLHVFSLRLCCVHCLGIVSGDSAFECVRNSIFCYMLILGAGLFR